MCCQGKGASPQQQQLPATPRENTVLVQHRVGPVRAAVRAQPIPSLAVQPQLTVPRTGPCPVCGLPMRVVNIAGKTQIKCSNPGCG